MNKNEIEAKIINCLENVNIYVDCNSSVDDIQLENYFESSIQFISFVVEIEKQFAIEIPDELLDIKAFKSLQTICDFLQEIIEQSKST